MQLAHVRETIAAPADRVWALLTDFANPQRLAPSIEACEATGSGAGATRVIRARGLVIRERLEVLDPANHRFSYRVLASGDPSTPGVSDYVATVVIHPVSPETTEIEWSSLGNVKGDATHASAHFTALYRRAIANLEMAARA